MMAVCMFWLLTYVGQGLDLAVGNRPMIIMQGAQEHDYRHGSSLRKKNELNTVGNNLLHLRIYPSEASHRDELSNWLLVNDEPRISSWTPAGILIDDMIKEPRELQTVFFALSPTMLNVLYSDYAASAGHQQSDQQHQEDQPSHLAGQQRGKKLRIDCRHSRNTVSLPIRVCDDELGRKTLHETRQSNYDELFEQKRNAAAANMKTDPANRGDKIRDYQASTGFSGRPFAIDGNKLPGKRSQVPDVARRAGLDLPGEPVNHQAQPPSPHGNGISIAPQLLLRSTRGSIQYDVPQIQCPFSEDGMERFACPNPDRFGRYHCIDDHALCDGFLDCPSGEDEDLQACMFYKTTKAHLDVLADAILRWARGR
ncbi:low-density lipoprotein receptor domain-containing jelly belly protein [Augochlora pura]